MPFKKGQSGNPRVGNKMTEKELTKRDAVDTMSRRIKREARHIKYGVLELHGSQKNGVPVLQVMNGEVVQCDLEIRPIERFRAGTEPE